MTTPDDRSPRLLALVRHARAESVPDQADHDRRLTDAGLRAATAAGRWLASHLPEPDVVWCSSATRATQTWGAMAVALTPREVLVERDLYLAGTVQVVERVRATAVPGMVVVGHNPTLEQVLAALTGHLRGMSPGAVALIDPARGRFIELWEPPG